MEDVAQLVARMVAGDNSSLARLITLIEKDSPDVRRIRELVNSYLHKAYRVGVTGLAGAGKSTLIDRLTGIARKRGLTAGIIAVDPSSAITGGAVLGDRIRMRQHYLDKGIFIRSMGTRGCYGGLSSATRDTVDLLDASGKDIIFIETTGVGQTETEIVNIADTVIVVLTPGFGDSIQLMKAGLIEIADIIVVNKADRDGSEALANEIRDDLMYYSTEAGQSIILTQAVNDIGIEELYRELEKRWRKQTPSSVSSQ